MQHKYRFIRRFATIGTIGRGFIYLVAPLYEKFDTIHKTLYSAPSYKYMAMWPEWVWGILFIIGGLGMIFPCTFLLQKCTIYRIGALFSLLIWTFTGVLNLFAFPLGAGWFYAGCFAFLCLITIIRPDEDAVTIARGY